MEKKFNILFVDKDEKVFEALKAALSTLNPNILIASNGDEAIDIIEHNKPDLIISEINLPKVDGWELCWLIRERPDLSNIPFIFLTSRAGVSDEVFSFELGADDFIKKPFIKNELLARVKALLTRIDRGKQKSIPDLGGVKGALKDMSLADILQVLNLGKRTAAVHLSKGEGRGSIFVFNGNIGHARYGDIKGEEALFHLLTWESGTFSVEMGASTNIKSVNLSIEMVLLEGFKRMDESKKRGTPPRSESMEEGEVLTLKTLFDLGIIEDDRGEDK